MKTAFAIDFLLERTPEVFMLELLLAGHEDAEIYCLAHSQGSILGPIERHRIIASPLSRFVDKKEMIQAKAWLLPSAARQLKIDPSVEQLIIISSGWAHTFVTGPQVKRTTWLYDWQQPFTQLKGLKRIFAPYHRQVKWQALQQEKQLSFSSQTLASTLGFEPTKIIPAAFKTEEFPFITDESHPGQYPHHLVLLDDAPVPLVKSFIHIARQRNVTLKFLGEDTAYGEEKAWNDPNVEFIGDHCEATTAALTHGARAVWALGSVAFPSQALGAQCCGRPVVVMNDAINREFLGEEGVWYLKQESDLAETLTEVEKNYKRFDRKALRRQGLKWNERLFKSQMKEFAGVGKSLKASPLLS